MRVSQFLSNPTASGKLQSHSQSLILWKIPPLDLQTLPSTRRCTLPAACTGGAPPATDSPPAASCTPGCPEITRGHQPGSRTGPGSGQFLPQNKHHQVSTAAKHLLVCFGGFCCCWGGGAIIFTVAPSIPLQESLGARAPPPRRDPQVAMTKSNPPPPACHTIAQLQPENSPPSAGPPCCTRGGGDLTFHSSPGAGQQRHKQPRAPPRPPVLRQRGLRWWDAHPRKPPRPSHTLT